MTALFFVLLLILYIMILKSNTRSTLIIFTIFVILWVAFFIPHTIRYINIQL